MKHKEVCDKIYDILKQVINEEDKIPKTYEEDLSQLLDSVGFVTLIVEIETLFNIEVDDDDFEMDKMNNVSKLGDLVSYYLIKSEN